MKEIAIQVTDGLRALAHAALKPERTPSGTKSRFYSENDARDRRYAAMRAIRIEDGFATATNGGLILRTKAETFTSETILPPSPILVPVDAVKGRAPCRFVSVAKDCASVSFDVPQGRVSVPVADGKNWPAADISRVLSSLLKMDDAGDSFVDLWLPNLEALVAAMRTAGADTVRISMPPAPKTPAPIRAFTDFSSGTRAIVRLDGAIAVGTNRPELVSLEDQKEGRGICVDEEQEAETWPARVVGDALARLEAKKAEAAEKEAKRVEECRKRAEESKSALEASWGKLAPVQ